MRGGRLRRLKDEGRHGPPLDQLHLSFLVWFKLPLVVILDFQQWARFWIKLWLWTCWAQVYWILCFAISESPLFDAFTASNVQLYPGFHSKILKIWENSNIMIICHRHSFTHIIRPSALVSTGHKGISLLYIPCMKYKYTTPWLCPIETRAEDLTHIMAPFEYPGSVVFSVVIWIQFLAFCRKYCVGHYVIACTYTDNMCCHSCYC